MICDITPPWIDPGVQVEKKDLNVAVRYLFRFISSTVMPSQNESILHHPKAAILGSNIDRERLNLGLIIEKEMAMRAKKSQTSLPFPELITELCGQARVPIVAKTDVEVISTSSTDIRMIKEEYSRDKAERKRTASMDTSLAVDLETLATNATPLTQAGEPSGTPSSSAPTTSIVDVVSPPPLTQTMLYKMGHLAHSVDVRASWVKATILGLIERAIVSTLSPIRDELRE